MKIYRKKRFIRIKNDLIEANEIRAIHVNKINDSLLGVKWRVYVLTTYGEMDFSFFTAEDADIELKKIRQQLKKAGCYLGD